jgi:hypothetical protein
MIRKILVGLLFALPLVAQAAITARFTGTAQTALTGGTITPTLGGTTDAGNLILCTIGQKNNVDYTEISESGATYTRLLGYNFDNSSLTHWCKIAAGGDADPSFSSSDTGAGFTIGGQCAVFAGALNTCASIVDQSASDNNAAANSIDIPAITPSVNNTLVIVGAFKENDFNAENAIIGASDALTELGEVQHTGAPLGIVWAYRIQTTAATVTPGVVTLTENSAAALSFAVSIKPLAVAPTFTGGSEPAIGTRTTSTIPVTATTACTDCTMHGVALADGGSATCAEIDGETATGAYKYFHQAMTADTQGTGTFSTYTDGTVRDGKFCLESVANGYSAVASIADMYKKAAFSVTASVTAQDENDYTITKTLDGAGSCTAVACKKDATTPDVTETLAGYCDCSGACDGGAGDVAAVATVTDASCEAGTMTLGGSLTRPIHDNYVAGTYGSQPSDLTTLADEMLDAPTGYQYDLLASVSATSPCKDLNDIPISPTIAAADVTKWPTTTSPSGYAFTAGTDCETQYTDPAGTRQTATLDVYDTSAGDWMSGGPTTVYFNNSAPACTLANCEFDSGETLINGVAMTSVDTAAWFSDVDTGDTSVITYSGDIPTNTSITDGVWTGTPSCASGNTAGLFTVTATDEAGDTAEAAATWVCYDQVAVPDCASVDVASCSTLASAVNLSISATFECSNLIVANGIISQGTSATTQVNPFTSFDVVASDGACSNIPPWTTIFLDDVTAVPAGSVYIGGAAYSQAGAHYVAAMPGSGVTTAISGLAYRNDGALVINVGGTIVTYTRGIAQTNLGETVAAVCSPDYVVAGVPMDPDGTVCMTDVN